MHFARMLIAVAGTVILAANAPHASASAPVSGPGALCVGGAGCLLTIQAAVDAAPVGATIRITAGTFAGGVTIGKSLRLVGSGAGRTVIRGGGPVLTISTRASGPPAVSISGVTVTGGTARGDGVEAWGGGIFIPAADDGTVGATVILKDVAVKGNLAVPTATSPSPSGVKCPAGDCPYAATRGGGIANFGTLTLDRSAVSDNGAVGYASDANGGGIFSALGALILTSSSVDGNRAVPDSIGRFAEGGGIFVDSGALTISYSRISNNRAELVTRWPIRPQGVLLDMNAHAGGIHVGDGSEVLIERTSIKGNAVRADDPDGEVVGFDSAILIGDSHLVMRRSVVIGNRVTVRTATSEDVGPSGTAVEVDGPAEISDSSITDNPVTVLAAGADAIAQATSGLAVFDFAGNPRQVTVRNTRISGNPAVARSPEGSALTMGAGVFSNSLLALDGVLVQRNTGTARAPSATAQGGGIWNGPFLSGPPVQLTLTSTRVVDNALVTSPNGIRQGAGLYTTEPITPLRSVIIRNVPDQCFGCDGSTAVALEPSTTSAADTADPHAPQNEVVSAFGSSRTATRNH